jgi:FkbM family methyltransferase
MLSRYLAKFAAFLPTPWKFRLKRFKPLYTTALRIGGRVVAIQTSAGRFQWHIDKLTCQRYLLGTFEPYMQEAFRRYIRPGAVVYDVGAHAGFHSLYCALLAGPTGRVIAFEPDPEAIDTLSREISANPGLRVEIIRCALSDSIGTLQLDTSIDTSQATIRPSGAVQIESQTIDALVTGGRLPPPDIIKIDVEGHEGHVLRGATDTLRKHKPIVLCDFNDELTFQTVSECTCRLGYAVVPGPPITAYPVAANCLASGELNHC